MHVNTIRINFKSNSSCVCSRFLFKKVGDNTKLTPSYLSFSVPNGNITFKTFLSPNKRFVLSNIYWFLPSPALLFFMVCSVLFRGNQSRFITKLKVPLYEIDFWGLFWLLKTKIGMCRPAHRDVKTSEVPGRDTATTVSPSVGGDYLTLTPGANFPLISEMKG